MARNKNTYAINPFRVALAFVRIPRLCLSLLLGPLIIGIGLVGFQLVLTSAYFKLMDRSAEDLEQDLSNRKHSQWLLEFLYGSSDSLPPIAVCRWESESPPSPDCSIQSFDVALQVSDPLTYDPVRYVQHFEGASRRLHVCRNCQADVTIAVAGDDSVTQLRGFMALGVAILAETFDRDISEQLVALKKASEGIETLYGVVLMRLGGVPSAINVTETEKAMVVIMNVGLFLVIALWLGLRAHRRVLDYFSRNGALLPLVAGIGKDSFYLAIWLITLLRVSAFLIACLPTTLYVLITAIRGGSAPSLAEMPLVTVALWLTAVVFSLVALTILVGVSELQHREVWVSWGYKYLPLVLCALGTLVWLWSILTSAHVAHDMQRFIGALPIVGLVPVLLTPIISVEPLVLTFHIAMSVALIVVCIRRNARWFAAHLEEV